MLETALQKGTQPTKAGATALEHDVLTSLADAAASQGDAEAAQQYGARALAMATEYGHPLYRAIARRAQAVADRLAGDLSSAESGLTDALAGFREVGARWQAGRTLHELGLLGAALGDSQAARGNFEAALVEFGAVRAEPDLERTRLALDSLPS